MLSLKEIQELESELEIKEEINDVYSKEMDNCIRASGVLYARLFELGQRVYMANQRPTT